MGSSYAKKAVDICLGEVGYQCECSKWNKYADELDKVDFFTGCGKKQCLDFCAVGLCWTIYKAIIDPSAESDPEAAKWSSHFFMYQSDICDMAAVVKYLYGYFADNNAVTDNPERGDFVIFQKSNGVMYHCGMVTDWNWDNDAIFVTEFNTEGGKVLTHIYSFSDIGKKIKCFCRPRYDGWEIPSGSAPVASDDENKEDYTEIIDRLAHEVLEGKYGNYPRRKQLINGLGYGNIYGYVQKRVNELLYR